MARYIISFIYDLFSKPTFLFSWLAIVGAGALILKVLYLIAFRFLNKYQKHNILLLTISIYLSIILIEGFLRVSNLTSTYLEDRQGHYSFINHGSYVDSLHTHVKNDTIYLGNKSEFLYSRVTNSHGVSDIEWELDKPKETSRIISIGDSFTEGDGAPADSTWPKFLNDFLLKDSIQSEVLNAGVCGSDPYFELNLLNNKLLDYHPDIVLMSLSTQDFLEDIAIRGGLERFNPSIGKKTRFGELIYAYSHISRVVFKLLGYSEMLVKKNKKLTEDIVQNQIPAVVDELVKFKTTYPDIEFYIFQFPHKYHFNNNLDLSLEKSLQIEFDKHPNLHYYDLFNCYQDKISERGHSYKNYYWQIDGHHNSAGYYLKAECIYNILKSDL